VVVVVVVATDFGRVTWKKKHFPRTKGRGRLNTGTEKPLAFMNVTLITHKRYPMGQSRCWTAGPSLTQKYR